MKVTDKAPPWPRDLRIVTADSKPHERGRVLDTWAMVKITNRRGELRVSEPVTGTSPLAFWSVCDEATEKSPITVLMEQPAGGDTEKAPALKLLGLTPYGKAKLKRRWTHATEQPELAPVIVTPHHTNLQLTGAHDGGLTILGIEQIWPSLTADACGKWLDVPATFAAERALAIAHAVVEWRSEVAPEGLIGLGASVGAQAMQVVRHVAPGRRILHDEHPERVILARRAYRGGRIINKRTDTTQPGVHLDINAAYPWLLTQHEYPTTRLGSMLDNPTIDLVRDAIHDGHGVIAAVRISQRKPWFSKARSDEDVQGMDRSEEWGAEYPVDSGNCAEVPDHCPQDDVIVPLGKAHDFETVVCTRGLQLMFSRPDVVTVHEIVKAQAYEMSDWLKPVGEYGLKLRADWNDTPFEGWAKCLSNFVHGKLGQRYAPFTEAPEWMADELFYEERYGATPAPFHDTERTYLVRRVFGVLEVQQDPLDAPFALPHVAAHITEDCRLQQIAVEELAGEGVLGGHTDSLLLTQEAYQRVEHLKGDDPGQWSAEDCPDLMVSKTGWWTSQKRRLAGVPRHSVFDREEGCFLWESYTLDLDDDDLVAVPRIMSRADEAYAKWHDDQRDIAEYRPEMVEQRFLKAEAERKAHAEMDRLADDMAESWRQERHPRPVWRADGYDWDVSLDDCKRLLDEGLGEALDRPASYEQLHLSERLMV